MTPMPHLLVSIGGNLAEWRDAMVPALDRPRLPLPYALGAALLKGRFELSAIDLRTDAGASVLTEDSALPFSAIYPRDQMSAATSVTDFSLLWGRLALLTLVRQAFVSPTQRRLLFFSYVWQSYETSTLRQRIKRAFTQQAARLAGGVVLMTAEQVEAARKSLPATVPVIGLTVGIDCEFYNSNISLSDISEADRDRVERLLQLPYVILPGDELRLNNDALDLVEHAPINLVRVSQYSHKGGIAALRVEAKRRGLGDRVQIFERISYPALRFLIRNAVAYTGLVDATWQPAGWTVACECLASGLPIVLYEGLVSRELQRLGAGLDILRAVPLHDTVAFLKEVRLITDLASRSERAERARSFASEKLNLEITGAEFAMELRKAICAE